MKTRAKALALATLVATGLLLNGCCAIPHAQNLFKDDADGQSGGCMGGHEAHGTSDSHAPETEKEKASLSPAPAPTP